MTANVTARPKQSKEVTVAFRLTPAQKLMLEGIRLEHGHKTMGELLRTAVGEFIRRHASEQFQGNLAPPGDSPTGRREAPGTRPGCEAPAR